MVDQGGKNWPRLICLLPTGIVHWSAGQLNETRFQEPLLTKSYWPGSSSSSGNWAPWTLSLTAFYFNHITINGPNAACELLTAVYRF
ncbi:DNA polymerase [Trichinella spiralis]|uniref:DNA polymerase n=1 Tax=Trichinella spiralis TaxID=6334 RepID=A0ABR3KIX6_TRISP